MTIEQAKEELIKRYKYLYENASFILAPFMCEDSKRTLIYLDLSIYDGIVCFFEDFLLSDRGMEESNLYSVVENGRNDKEYLEGVKRGLVLLDKDNECWRLY